MKKLILAAAAVMMTTTAHAACTQAELEGMDNPVRYNPTELSAYQECWLDVHKADEEHGVLGSIFWVKFDDSYYSANLSTLSKLSDPAAYFENMIVADIEAVIARETVVIEQANKMAVQLIQAGVPEETVEMLVEQAFADGVASVDITIDNQAAFDAGVASVDVAKAITVAIETANTNAASTIEAALTGKESTNANQRGLIVHARNAVKSNGGRTNELARMADEANVANGLLTKWEMKFIGFTYSGYQLSNAFMNTLRVNGVPEHNLQNLANIIHEKVKLAYYEGYDDGYNDGYRDGYADGFTDGVNSVK